MIIQNIIKKAKETTKEEVKESICSHKVEIFCGAMAVIAVSALCIAIKGPRPNVTYVTLNLKGTIGTEVV